MTLQLAPEILDVCCGGRMWWWDKAHPLAVYMDNRSVPPGASPRRPNWSVQPDMVGDFRALPFEDGTFQLVLFDPPHNVRDKPGDQFIGLYYGALPRAAEQEDIHRGFAECWRVLRPGGTLVFKWAGPLDRVQPHFPATPIVGTRSLAKKGPLGTRWLIFYKPLDRDRMTDRRADLERAILDLPWWRLPLGTGEQVVRRADVLRIIRENDVNRRGIPFTREGE